MKPIVHGTHYAYDGHGCRCEICTAFKKEYWKQYSERRKKSLQALEKRREASRKYYWEHKKKDTRPYQRSYAETPAPAPKPPLTPVEKALVRIISLFL